MLITPPTIVLRHRRENVKKCSLRGLEKKANFSFLTYPLEQLPELSGYLLLSLEGEPLTLEDQKKGLLILDGTWRYAERMQHFVSSKVTLPCRSIPKGFKTAYPRRQNDCSDPSQGLASIEAIYIAYKILGRSCEDLLEHYHWKDAFLSKNEVLFKEIACD